MSSHREAPAISKDPVADNTDVYAFRSPDSPSTVTLIANFIPLQTPAAGPNFFEFGDDVLYEIHIYNGDLTREITYQFRFSTQIINPNTFLYNVGPIGFSGGSYANWNRPQTYSVTRRVTVSTGGPLTTDGGQPILGYYRPGSPRSTSTSTLLATGLLTPPCNIGPRSTPNYATNLAAPAVQTLPSGEKVFAGQRREGFYVDLGSIFDLLDLAPFQGVHVITNPPAEPNPTRTASGTTQPMYDTTRFLNVHSIAIQVPISLLTADGTVPTNAAAAGSVIGVYASASRQRITLRGDRRSTRSYPNDLVADPVEVGPFLQVSRLANPLFNEVIVPMAQKDLWNSLSPLGDSRFAPYTDKPEVAQLLPGLYPGVFPNLAAFNASGAKRADITAILLTGLPSGLIPGFQNYTGPTQADLLRLNLAIAPTTTNPNPLGLVAGDAAGFPNGRRVFDNTTAVELRALAGALLPLVAPNYTPDGAASQLTDGTNPGPAGRYLDTFPYLGTPLDGFDYPANPVA